MNKYLLLLTVISLLSGCSVFGPAENGQNTLATIPAQKIRLLSNEPLQTDYPQVMKRYQRYLDVATEAEMRVRVAHRMANLKLQAEEQQADVSGEVPVIASINDYEALLAAYPDRTDNDAILYQLARACSLAGETQRAVMALERLADDYPHSDYYLESVFRTGQLLYASHDYQGAEQAYQRLLDYGPDNNQYYVNAGYLLGWSVFKQGRTEDSLLAFTRLLDEQYPDKTSLDNARGGDQDMLSDILRIMAVMFDDLGDWEQIARFYDVHGQRHYEYLLYDHLATLYYDRNYYKSGASTLRAFVLRYPDDELAPVYYERLIDGYKKARYPELMRKHKEIYIRLFGVGTPYWEHHSDAVRQQLTASLSGYLWDMAGFWHAWGQNANNATDRNRRLQQAEHWYLEYIRSFPQAGDTVKAHFLLAEVAFELNDYPLAKDHYEIVAYQYPQYDNAAEAGYAAVLAYNRYHPQTSEAVAWRQATAASAMRFVHEFPQDERRGTVLVNTAEMLLQDKYYRQALLTARSAQESGMELPARYRYGAALVHGHSAFELGLYAEAEQSLLQAQEYADISRQQRQALRNKVAAAVYKQGEVAREQGDLSGAVTQWRRLATVIPESDTRIIAEYDAATLLMQMKEYDQAIDVLLQFRQQYPEHRLTQDIPSKLIVAYEDKGEWRNAAFELQRIWKNSPDNRQQRIACFQSAEYFARAGDSENAVVMYRRYAHSYPRPFDAALEAHTQLDQIYAARGDEEKRRFWLDKIIRLHNGAGKDQTDRSRYLAARAAYELGEYGRVQYEKIALTLPLDKSVVRKNTAMQEALRRYTQAAQMGVLEYTTSATYRIGELYKQLARGLMNSERPAGLDEVDQEEYQYLLEDQAFPLEEAAIEVHQTNTGRTYDGLYDEWIKKSYRSLAELMPGQYDKHEKVPAYAEQIR